MDNTPNASTITFTFKRGILIAYLIGVIGMQLLAQGTLIPLGFDHYHYVDRIDIKHGLDLQIQHTAVKPYSRKWIGKYAQQLRFSGQEFRRTDTEILDYLMRDNSEWIDSIEIKSRKPILKVFYKEPASFYSIDVKDFIFKINPVLDFQLGRDSESDELIFQNTRGAEFRAYIKKKLGIYTYIGENQSRPPLYVQQRILNKEAVPGEGFYKPFKTTGVDYFTARGYIIFNVIDVFDLQLGHDRNFIGNGYRSLLLSDFSNNYFFFKLNTKVWRINYQNIFMELTNQYDRGADRLLDKKYGAFHHLNISVTNWLDIGLFEGVILNRSNHFELQYLNPIIFYRAIEQDLGSPDNAIVGLDFKVNFLKHFSVYGQGLLDEFNFSEIRSGSGWWGNKFGVQLGLKYIDVANIANLDYQFELNTVRPFTYTHSSTANYTHYNQEMAHPLGANFREFINIVKYQPRQNINFSLKHIYYVQGIDSGTSNWGGDIFLNSIDPDTRELVVQQEYGNEIGQGVKHTVHHLQLLATYMPWHNIFFDLNMTYRDLKSTLPEQNQSSIIFQVSARMNIPYRRYDF